MKKSQTLFVILAAVLLASSLPAQEKPAAVSTSDSAAAAYRVQVVISEYDGANKISSLPYTIPVAHSRDLNDPFCFRRKAAWFNSAGLMCGRRLRMCWAFPGQIRFNLTRTSIQINRCGPSAEHSSAQDRTF